MSAVVFDDVLQVKLPSGFRDRLIEAARDEQTTLSAFVRQVLREHLKDRVTPLEFLG